MEISTQTDAPQSIQSQTDRERLEASTQTDISDDAESFLSCEDTVEEDRRS
jgi:hypothetical protein